MAHIIDGKAIAKDLKGKVAQEIETLDQKPGLAVILVGDDPASKVYVQNKIKACGQVGINSVKHVLPPDTSSEDIENLILDLNNNDEINGILLQLPLPPHLDSSRLIQLIKPEKDVDGLNLVNVGALASGVDGMVPCTPQGCLILIKSIISDLSGLNAVVIGRSLLLGKPMAQLLLRENCTVTMAHSQTKDIADICKNADIIVAAVGKEKLVKADWVKEGACVIDVGINRMENGKLCGDVDFEDVVAVAGAISPVPGGVGPMTIACLMANTLKAKKYQS